jgi:preprotein translocase subunit SecY
MIQAVRSAFALPDLRKKILYTFLILAIYRLFSHVPVPGVNSGALEELFRSNQLLGLLDLLSGGAMANFSIMAMGVYPYITATIILQLLTPIIPSLQKLCRRRENRDGTSSTAYGWYMTVPLAAAAGLRAGSAHDPDERWRADPGRVWLSQAPVTTAAILLTMTAGTLFAVWLGEQISSQGIGNGTSIIILGGIVTRLPQNILNLIIGEQWLVLILFVIITLITVLGSSSCRKAS